MHVWPVGGVWGENTHILHSERQRRLIWDFLTDSHQLSVRKIGALNKTCCWHLLHRLLFEQYDKEKSCGRKTVINNFAFPFSDKCFKQDKKSPAKGNPRSRIPRLVLHPFQAKDKGSPLSDSLFSEEEGKECDVSSDHSKRTISTNSFCSSKFCSRSKSVGILVGFVYYIVGFLSLYITAHKVLIVLCIK